LIGVENKAMSTPGEALVCWKMMDLVGTSGGV
jgi:hypothetical protein